MSTRIYRLEDALQNIATFPWNHALFCSNMGSWNADTQCVVLDPEDSEEPDDNPQEAVDLGMDYVLSIQDIQSIVENVILQGKEKTTDTLLKALEFYFNNDAYIDLD